ALRSDPADEHAAGDDPDERTAAVGAEQQARLELRQVVPVGEVGEQRDDRPEQHRVQEDDRPGDRDDPAHRARICVPLARLVYGYPTSVDTGGTERARWGPKKMHRVGLAVVQLTRST